MVPFAVWIVPMRNWNFLYLSPPHQLRNRFGSYLWGIETHFEQAQPISPPSVWIVPMRNWNSLCQPLTGHRAGLDRTYEELKPPGLAYRDRFLRSLDRTYEELKHAWEHQIKVTKIESLDRTYEELKHISGILDWMANIVWIVPMRNWNTTVKTKKGGEKSSLDGVLR